MPKYAVKLGELLLQSNKPITPEERKAALKGLRKDKASFVADLGYGLELKLRVEKN